jgi:hypothetical protein
LGEVRDVFCGGALLCSIMSNLGTELQLEAIILEAGSLVPPAKGTVVTVDSVAYIVRESSVAETDAEEAKLSLTLQKYAGTTYAEPPCRASTKCPFCLKRERRSGANLSR